MPTKVILVYSAFTFIGHVRIQVVAYVMHTDGIPIMYWKDIGLEDFS